jgi:hypothetical protein
MADPTAIGARTGMGDPIDNLRQISNGMRVLKIGHAQDVALLERSDIVFDALETGPDLENFLPLAPYAPRIQALWYCATASAVGLERLDHLESITANSAWLGFDFRQLERLKSLSCADVSAIPARFLNHPHLEVLDCGEGKIESMQLLGDAVSMRHLRLNACKVKSLEGIGSMPALRELRLTEARVLNDIDGLKACSHLQCLVIEPARQVTRVDALRSLHALRVLYVSAPAAVLTDVDWIAQAPALRCAFLDVPLERIDWERLADHPSIYSLSLRVPTTGMTDSEAAIARVFEAHGRVVKEVKRYTKVVQVELEPPANLPAPLPLSHYMQRFGSLPPN